MLDTTKLEETFNVPPAIIEGEFTVEEGKALTVSQPKEVSKVEEKLEDSDFIRNTLKDLASKTNDALDLALQIQADDPNSRNTEAVAKMADAVSKALTSLIHLNKTEKEENFRSKPEAPTTVNNNLTVITTEDLIEKIVKQTKQLTVK